MLSAEKKIVLNMRLLSKPHSNHKICAEWRHKIIKGKLRKISCKATKLKWQKQKEKEAICIQNNQKTKDKMAVLNPQLSIITLNINRLNLSVKRQTVARWINKQKTQYMLPPRHSPVLKTNRLKLKV